MRGGGVPSRDALAASDAASLPELMRPSSRDAIFSYLPFVVVGDGVVYCSCCSCCCVNGQVGWGGVEVSAGVSIERQQWQQHQWSVTYLSLSR